MAVLPLLIDAKEAIDHYLKAQSLTDAERAYVISILSKEGFSNQRIRAALGISKVYTVTHLLRVGKSLSIEELTLWHSNASRITLGHLRAIAKMPQNKRESLMRELLTKKIPVFKYEALAKGDAERKDVDIQRYEQIMGEVIGRNVKISFNQAKKSGTISLDFYGLDDLDNISERLGFSAGSHIG